MRHLLVALLFFLLVHTTAFAKLQETPYIPESNSGRMSNFAISATTGFIVSSHEPLFYNAYTQSQSRYTALKGTFGETLMDEFFTETGEWQRIDSAKVTWSRSKGTVQLAKEGNNLKTGIDGIYVQFDKNGNPKSLLVGEAKANGAQITKTRTELQMSPAWRNERLSLNAQRLSDAAKVFRGGKYSISYESPPAGQESTTIPNGRNGKITYWFDKNTNQWKAFSEPPTSGKQVALKLETLARYFQGAAEGRISYRSRIFMVDARNEIIKIEIINADNGEIIRGGPSPNKFSNLPKNIQKAIRSALNKAVVIELVTQNGMSIQDAETHASKVISHAEKTGKMHELINEFYPKIAWHQKLLAQLFARPTILGGISGGLLAGIFELGDQALSGHFDFGRVTGMTALGAISAGAATWGGVKIEQYIAQKLNQTASSGLSQSAKTILSRIGGGFAGGSIASAVFAYGAYAGGYMDKHEAHRNAIAGVVGTGVGTGAGVAATYLVSTFGAASTGTAISSLSGAAATNATLAWFGGGAATAGGLGTAGGAIILSGGTAIVIMAASSAVIATYRILDKKVEEDRVFNLTKTIRVETEERIKLLEMKGI